MDLHHQPDQSYRIPRRARAEAIQARTQALLEDRVVRAAELLDAPARLLGGDAPVVVQVAHGFSQDVAMAQAGRTGVLIFGSANRPGGGWLNGAKAQEEDVSLASTWATQAALAPAGFYAHQAGLGGLGPDQVLLAEGLWLSGANGEPLASPQGVVFAGVAAPNLQNPETSRLARETLIDHLARRLAGALLGWQSKGVQHAVMGAIGCGVFRWPGQDSALALRRALNHFHAQGGGGMHVVLAMPDKALAQSFQDVLGAPSAKRHTPRR